MAATVQRLAPIKLPPGPTTTTPDQTYWDGFKNAISIPSLNNFPITHISSPGLPAGGVPCDLFAVTSGTRVQLFSIRSRKLVKTISRFDDTAHGAELRRDGRLVAVGDESGTVQVFDAGSRAILKTWKQHRQGVWAVKFQPRDATALVSASDDKSVRLWDLPSDEPVQSMFGHTDYVRSLVCMEGAAAGLILSGSYDETVRMWDPRTREAPILTLKHAAPIEDILAMPSGDTIVAAAGNEISIFDLVAGKTLEVLQNHQKTVSTLSLASQGTRLVSGGLDGHVKVYETQSWKYVFGTKYSSPVLSSCVVSAGSEREDRHIVVGQESGILSIKTRLSGEQKVREREREQQMQALMEGKIDDLDRRRAKKAKKSGLEKRDRGLDFNGEGADVIIDGRPPRPAKLKIWEKSLHRGKYGLALDQVLESTDRNSIVTLLTALNHRSALKAALADRDDVALQPIFRWTCKHIVDPRLSNLCVDIGLLIVELYSAHMGESAEVDELTRRLHSIVRREVERSQQAWQTLGMMDTLLVPA